MTSVKRTRTLRTRSKRANASERISNACRTRFGAFDRSERVLYPFVSTWLLNDESIMHASLIRFYKSIDDFKQFDIEDQVLLVKCNLINIIHLHHIIIQNFQDNPLIGQHMSKWIDEDFHNQMSRTRRYFYRFMKYPL
jgi:hypothetical protein